jgi:ornithine cyclodeaminase/alanine dehydrogenase-like protein (mu-crystallin family)
LVLTRADIAELMDEAAWLDAAETAFAAAAQGTVDSPAPMSIKAQGGTFHAKGAAVRLDRLYVALKLNGNFPGNPEARRLPTIQGALLLCDGETGSLLAIMDSIEVTLRRTAAATALAARFLARPESRRLLVCGCGEQGAAQLAALRAVLPIDHVLAWDRDPGRSRAFAIGQSREGLAVQAASSLAEAALASDVIVTCTTADAAFLESGFVRPGTFVAAVGADSPEKSEIHPSLMRRSIVVADRVDQCVAMGDLRLAIATGAMERGDVHAELAELVAGAKKGRSEPDQVTLFDSTGIALQDVAAAAVILCRALAAGSFRSVALGAPP